MNQDRRFMCFGVFRMDLADERLWLDDKHVRLTPKAFAMLRYLIERPGQLVTKEALLDAVWPDATVSEGVLKNYMSELRRALGDQARTPAVIETVHRRGYRFIAAVAAESDSPPALVTGMEQEPVVRRLAAIFSADVKGYSRLMEHDDEATVYTLTTYRAVMATRIEHYHGRVVDAPGDNLLAEFASVIDAVACAMDIQQELAHRNHTLPDHRQMWFRIGINLGDVLVAGDRIYGDGVNMAARLEGLAEGGGVCISGAVYDQVETKLDLAYIDLGEQAVKNIARPVHAYRVEPISALEVSPPFLGPEQIGGQTRPDGVDATPYLVSRERELDQLHQRLIAAKSSQRQVLFVSGEAGIGKTALVDAFVQEVMQTQEVDVSRGQCIDQYGAGEAYLPLLEALGQLLRGPHGVDLVGRLKREAPSWLLQFPAFVPEAEFNILQSRASGATRERMLRELAEFMDTLTATRPLVLVLEDLHWSDVSTLDWLAYTARRRQPARLLMLSTFRPVDAMARDHSVRTVTQELLLHGHGVELALAYWSEAGMETYLRQRLSWVAVPEALTQRLYRRTNGNPLFVRTIVDALEQQGALQAGTHGEALWEEPSALEFEVPGGIKQLIVQQLEQLTPDEQAFLEMASVAGADFSAAAVAIEGGDTIDHVEAQCAALARRGQFIEVDGTAQWPDGTVASRCHFIHDLYRETLYERVTAGRRRRLHEQIGLRLEAGYGRAARDIATELAEHFEHGYDYHRAVSYLQRAAQNALQRSAQHEAITLLNKALRLVSDIPDEAARAQLALRVYTLFGPILMATQGYAASAVGHTYERARELCQLVGDRSALFAVLMGQWGFYLLRADLQTARELSGQCVQLAMRDQNPGRLIQAHFALGTTLLWLGELAAARDHLEAGIALPEPTPRRPHAALAVQDPRVRCRAYAAWTWWLLGYPERALQRGREAIVLAEELAHPFSLAFAHFYASQVHHFRREARKIRTSADRALALCHEHGFAFYLAQSMCLQGCALNAQGQGRQAMELMRRALAAHHATEANLGRAGFLMVLAEACMVAGLDDEGLTVVAEALSQAENTHERFYEVEIYRLRGELLLMRGETDAEAERQRISLDQTEAAEACFQQAIAVARQQGAKSLELRAVMSLCQLWQQQGERGAAHDLLAPIYHGFSEGLDTPDLQDALRLLNALDDGASQVDK